MNSRLLAFLLLITLSTFAATSKSADAPRISEPGKYAGYSPVRFDGYKLTSQYVAVRDGTRLAVDLFRPTSNGVIVEEKLPVLWMHTPYNRRNYRDGLTAANYPGKALQLVKYGYVVAVVDYRGLYASFGHNAGFNRGEWQDAARMDAYDITEWLAKQSWSTGKIGMWGCSATGGSQMQALSTAPSNLKAIFPMSCEWDVYAFVAGGGMTPPAGVPTQIMRGGAREARDRTAVAVDENNKDELVEAIAEHKDNIETSGFTPYRDSAAENFNNQWWLKSSPHTYANTINRSGIAVYAAANWNEGATGYGAAFIYNNLRLPKKLILGPATHCDWTTVLKDTGFDIIVEEHRFFDHWLKGIDNGVMKENAVTYFTYNEAPGKEWKTSPTWPLRNEHRTKFFLSPSSLSTNKPNAVDSGTTATVDYAVTDATFWNTGLSFMTGRLSADTEVTGHSTLTLWLQSTANDADVIARLDDVAPDGSHRYLSVEGRLRASLRATAKPPYNNLGLPWHPFTKSSSQPLKPGEPVQMSFDLFATSYVFKAGHRIRLTLQFADARATPKIEPAPRVTVMHNAKMPSALTLPIIPR